ncbi:hypothetical protein AB0D71_31825 [Streptomyces avermitilis]|uniref:hypothetical protein n=1 Tax=Streptomyces avermitilis TaxID=33903 RepID=UPI0033F01990
MADDLARNTKEQERISEEIDALQEQLRALQQDHSTLVNIHQALGIATAPAEPAPASVPASVPVRKNTAVPAPRTKAATERPAGKRTRTKKDGASQSSPAQNSPAQNSKPAKKPATKDVAAKAVAKPTLVELIHSYLAEQREPRSAAEITSALGQTHTDRHIQTNVVRTTLEGLVAKSRAHRSKQGSSVFYTAPGTDGATTPAQAETKAEPKTETKAGAKAGSKAGAKAETN